MIKELDINQNLTVGEEYVVPCILHNGDWLAVAGEPHVDDDHFNSSPKHWHVDTRFHPDIKFAINYNKHWTPQPRRMKCLSTSPNDLSDESTLIRVALSMTFAGMKKPACGRCPHKGMPIHNNICSGHRLEWDEDGELKYKPPFRVRIEETRNVGWVEKADPARDGKSQYVIVIDIHEAMTVNQTTALYFMDGKGALVGRYFPRHGDVLVTPTDQLRYLHTDRGRYS